MSRRHQLGFALALAATLLGAQGHAEAALPGKSTYEQLCVNCHGPLGKGDGPGGLDAYPIPRDFSVGEFKFDADGDGETGTDADLTLVIRDGAGPYGGSPLMAPWGHLSEDQLAELVAYLRSLRVDP
jgi:mono/diheme cytochrome c family protein